MSDIVFRMDNTILTYPQHRYEKKKGFDKTTIGPITLDLYQGEVLGVIGRNGSNDGRCFPSRFWRNRVLR
jgi:ABC-type polysaccharide/polyol phosphate transport system ATPase subunit